jgi:hypothetical protein
MSRNRFVTPDTVRLPLSDGDWIEVKQRLTNGERRRLNSAALGKSMPLGAEVTEIAVDFAEMGTARALTYIVDWSLEDDGHRVPFTREAFLSLDEETAAEIDAVLDAHIETIAGNSPTASVNGSAPASPSASGSADGPGATGLIYQIT